MGVGVGVGVECGVWGVGCGVWSVGVGGLFVSDMIRQSEGYDRLRRRQAEYRSLAH